MNEIQGNNLFYNGGTQLRCPICKNIVTDKFCPFCSNDMTGEFNYQYTEYMKRQNNLQQQYQQPFYQGHPNQQQYYNNTSYQQPYAAYQYQTYPMRKKNNAPLIVTLCILGALLLTVAVIFINFITYSVTREKTTIDDQYGYRDEQFDNNAYYMPDGVSLKEFNRLKKGLTYAHVSSIIGGDGVLVNNGESIQGEDFYTYAWVGENSENALVYITFTNDVVTDITLEGSLE